MTAARFYSIEDWESFVNMKRELIELKTRHLNLQTMLAEKTEELEKESEKRANIERKLAMLKLEVSKLEGLNLIGQLAAGLGHEVRNPMTTIRGFLQMLQCKVDLATYKSYFDLMIEELDRTNSIITNFLSLAKAKPPELTRQCLNKLINNLFPLLQADAYSNGKRLCYEPGDIVEFEFDANEITQLVLNFARNGLDAMSTDGCLTIQTYMDGQNVVLSVRDEGKGIPPENMEKIGTPFFTTKENGTGLGLPMCYNIADKHHAQIGIKSSPEGTTFIVTFPQTLVR